MQRFALWLCHNISPKPAFAIKSQNSHSDITQKNTTPAANITKCFACHEKRHFNITECCACHEKWPATSPNAGEMLRLPRKVPLQHPQLLRLPRKVARQHHAALYMHAMCLPRKVMSMMQLVGDVSDVWCQMWMMCDVRCEWCEWCVMSCERRMNWLMWVVWWDVVSCDGIKTP